MIPADIKRWMYRGNHPNWIAKFMNRVAAMIGSAGLSPDLMVTLEVTGRKSGKTISLPLAIAHLDGQRYLVSMLGDHVQWVENVRAAGGKAALRSGQLENVLLEDVPVEQRARIIKVYLQRAPGARAHIPVNKDAPVADFEKIAADFPVFKIVSQSAS